MKQRDVLRVIAVALSSLALVLACRFHVDVDGVPEEIQLRSPFFPPAVGLDAALDAADASEGDP